MSPTNIGLNEAGARRPPNNRLGKPRAPSRPVDGSARAPKKGAASGEMPG
jgi:hypothetical protein